jgi:hypothetical protein
MFLTRLVAKPAGSDKRRPDKGKSGAPLPRGPADCPPGRIAAKASPGQRIAQIRKRQKRLPPWQDDRQIRHQGGIFCNAEKGSVSGTHAGTPFERLR